MILLKYNERIHLFLTGIIAFLIPSYPNLLPVAIGLLIINWLMVPKLIVPGIKKVFTSKTLLPIVVFYLLYILGMFYTNNTQTGLETLETKFSFLILPIVFASYTNTTKANFNNYLMYFIFGCVLSALICLGYATYSYFKPVLVILYGVPYDLGSGYFYYNQLSLFFHPSYIALYCVFSLFSILYLKDAEKIKLNSFTNKTVWVSIMTLLILFILLLSSKAGWIGLFIFTVYLFIYLLKYKQTLNALAIIALLAGSFYFLNIYNTPRFSARIPKLAVIKETLQNNNTTSKDSNGSRILVWKAAIDIIKVNFVTGVGTGDAKDAMLETYKAKGMISEYEHKLNSHNQYFNTFIALGILGFLSLLFSLLIPFYYSFKERNVLFMAFIGLASINFLFESMLERQAGVIFFVYFYTLLCLSLTATNPKSKIPNP
jgi:O-antigen ligase